MKCYENSIIKLERKIMEHNTYQSVRKVITDTITNQSDTFSAKDIIFAVRKKLAGTGLDEKRAFTEVARMCGRELRCFVENGKISHTSDGRYLPNGREV